MGKFSYKEMHYRDIEALDSEVWSLVLGYKPSICVFLKGWYMFVFKSEAHATCLLNSTWMKGHGIRMLKRWHYSFDPIPKRMKKI